MSGRAFQIAQSQVGKNSALISDYLRTGGQNLNPVELAWCAAFVNSSLQQAGVQGSGSNLARSFLNVGTATDAPQRGDLAVFSRGNPNGPFGHVGFYDGTEPDGRIRVLGGNQSGAVNFKPMDANRLLGFRRVGDGAQGEPAPAAPGALANVFGAAAPNAGVLAAENELAQTNVFAPAAVKPGEDEDARKKRRQALFGGDLAGLYS